MRLKFKPRNLVLIKIVVCGNNALFLLVTLEVQGSIFQEDFQPGRLKVTGMIKIE